MADAALATQSRSATNVSRVERSSARGATTPVRPVSETEAFKQNFSAQPSGTSAISSGQVQEQPSGGGLLSTGVQMLLAETRTQEAGTTFVPPSSVGRALNSYLATQAKVRETIRDNIGSGPTPQSESSTANREPDSGEAEQTAVTSRPAPQLSAAIA